MPWCKQDMGLLGVEQHQKSLLCMYKMRPGQMGTSNLSMSMGAMNVDGCRGQAWVAQVTSKLVSSRTKILLMNNGRMH